MRSRLLLTGVLLCGPLACAAETASIDPEDADEAAASGKDEPGNFHEVIPGKIYRGFHPSGKAQVDFLRREYNIKTVLDLRLVEREAFMDHEKGDVRSHPGMEYINIRINPWITVDEKGINEALKILNDETKYPVYIHCRTSIDRTGTVVALHRVENEGWSPSCAHAEWAEYGYTGYHTTMFGQFLRYFEKRARAFNQKNGLNEALDLKLPFSSCDGGQIRSR